MEYVKTYIDKEDIVGIAERMRADGVILAMIHGFITDKGLPNVSYEFLVGGKILSYAIEGEWVIPSIAGIYDKAAEWPEREINELMNVTFQGLDTSKRLFLPETMFEGQGQIIVTPMDELIDKARGKRGTL